MNLYKNIIMRIDLKNRNQLLLMAGIIVIFALFQSLDKIHTESFKASDEVTLPSEANITIPKGFSIRNDRAVDEGIMFASFNVDGWYYLNKPCTQIEDVMFIKDKKHFPPEHFIEKNKEPIGTDMKFLSVCADADQDGVVRFYTNKKTKNMVSKDEAIEVLKAGIQRKVEIDELGKVQSLK